MKITELLTAEEIAFFTSKSDFEGWKVFLYNWTLILAIMYIAWRWPNPLVLFLVVIFLGGRQLGLSVLMHECGHKTLFKTPKLNEIIGQWFCAMPVMSELHSYARGHLKHHRNAGTKDDPDLPNYRSYPVDKASFKRKVIRDITGQTGSKLLLFIFKGAGDIVSREKREGSKPFVQALFVQVALFLALSWLFAPWVYLLWVVAFLTSFMLIVRLRQIAEHAAVPDLFDLDPRKNTRTTRANWLEQQLLAPNYVNYHLEHHFMAGVPCYRLKALHETLLQKGTYTDTPIFNGYLDVFRHAVRT